MSKISFLYILQIKRASEDEIVNGIMMLRFSFTKCVGVTQLPEFLQRRRIVLNL
jgi:hypothetical protein